MRSLNGHIGPCNYVEFGVVNIFRAHNLISFKHIMFFWCPFLDPHLTTHHSNIGVHFSGVLDEHCVHLRCMASGHMQRFANAWRKHLCKPALKRNVGSCYFDFFSPRSNSKNFALL